MKARLFVLALASCLAVACSSATEPWSYLGQWTGTSAQLGTVTLRIDLATADSVAGRLTFTGSGTGFGGLGLTAAFTGGRLHPDSLVFDIQQPAQLGFAQFHGRVTRLGDGVFFVLVGYDSLALARQ